MSPDPKDMRAIAVALVATKTHQGLDMDRSLLLDDAAIALKKAADVIERVRAAVVIEPEPSFVAGSP